MMMRGSSRSVVVVAVVIVVSMAALQLFQCNDVVARGIPKPKSPNPKPKPNPYPNPKPKPYTYTIAWKEYPDTKTPFIVYRAEAGDLIVFKYNIKKVNLNVAKVPDQTSYDNCNATGSNVDVRFSGNDKFTLQKGDNYFICGIKKFCGKKKMKIKVNAV